MKTSTTTLDGLLNQRVKLEQPAKGYRVAIDTVLLAAAVPAKPGDRVLDLGCGAGGAMLCLAARVPGLSITGVEIQPDLAELCRRNIARNNFDAKMDVIEGDLTKMDLSGFDHVMMNPPYYEEGTHDVSPHQGKRIANAHKDGDLELWFGCAEMALKPGGNLHLTHRASRQAELVALAATFFSRVEIVPILPKVGERASRILLRGYKAGGAGPAAFEAVSYKPLILQGDKGGYTGAAEDILRHMKPMEFTEEMT